MAVLVSFPGDAINDIDVVRGLAANQTPLQISMYLSLNDPVHDGLQGLVSSALHHSLEVLRAVFQRLSHTRVQVVVRFLCRQVLHTITNTERRCI